MLGTLRVGWDLKVIWSILCLQTQPLPIQGWHPLFMLPSHQTQWTQNFHLLTSEASLPPPRQSISPPNILYSNSSSNRHSLADMRMCSWQTYNPVHAWLCGMVTGRVGGGRGAHVRCYQTGSAICESLLILKRFTINVHPLPIAVIPA